MRERQPLLCGTIPAAANRRFVWCELFYDLIIVAALSGAWLAVTLAVMLVLIQMFSITIALLAIGRRSESVAGHVRPPLLYTVLPLIYIAVALVALWPISRRCAAVPQSR